MPADDHPFDALENQLKMEDASVSPVSKIVLHIASFIPLWPFDKVLANLKENLGADSAHRVRVMVETCMNQVRKLEDEFSRIRADLSAQQARNRAEVARDLVVDATRKAINTRAIERVRRIGLILANGTTEPQIDADEVEEMMRIAMEVSDDDLVYLLELAKLEAPILAQKDHIDRYTAYTVWPKGFWGGRVDNTLDSVFSKLESYGLVARLAPPNNLNIYADFQNMYVLLKKGQRFSTLIQEKTSA
jgi:hypothetical protein